MRIVGVLAAIQAIQIGNIIPLLIDPRPEFLLGLVANFITGGLAIPVAYIVWTRREDGWLIALLFGIFAFASATYFGHLVATRFGTPSLLQPLSISPIMMTVNLALIILLLFSRLSRKPPTAMNR